MKKLLIVLLVLALTVLAGCGSPKAEAPAPSEAPAPESAPAHTHAAEVWDRDHQNHWQLCECGEQFNQGAHELDDASICTVCGSEIWDYGSGISVSNYNAYGDWTRMSEYDPEGNVVFDEVTEMEYDADGNKLWEKTYSGDMLVTEYDYAANEAGEWNPTRFATYFDDGTWSENFYDSNGNVVRAVTYDAEGNMETEEISEYLPDDYGWYYLSKSTLNWGDGAVHISEYDSYSNQTLWQVWNAEGVLETQFVTAYTYDEMGNVLTKVTDYSGERTDTTTYTYDDEGNLLLEVEESTNGYYWEMRYEVDEDGDSNSVYSKESTEDGGWRVCEYDSYGDMISEVFYDANGNEITE